MVSWQEEVLASEVPLDRDNNAPTMEKLRGALTYAGPFEGTDPLSPETLFLRPSFSRTLFLPDPLSPGPSSSR